MINKVGHLFISNIFKKKMDGGMVAQKEKGYPLLFKEHPSLHPFQIHYSPLIPPNPLPSSVFSFSPSHLKLSLLLLFP